MSRPHPYARRLRAAGALACSAVLIAVVAAPAQAADWPSEGYVPTCDELTWNENLDNPVFTYTDRTAPKIIEVTTSAGNPAILGPGTVQLALQVRVEDTCSGVGSVDGWLRRGGGVLEPVTLTAATPDQFSGLWGVGAPASADDAGKFTLPLLRAKDRYDTFQLNEDFRLVGKTDGGRQVYVNPPYGSQALILRQTALALTAKTSVPANKPMAITGTVQFARQTGYVPYAGANTTLEYRTSSTGTWTKIKTVKATTTGTVAFTFTPRSSIQLRLTTPGERGALFTAPGESPLLSVKVGTSPAVASRPGRRG